MCPQAAQAATLTLAWDANPEPDIAGYILSWGTQAGGYYANSVNVGNQTSWQVTGLASATVYHFVVRGYNTAGLISDFSAEVSGRTAGTISPGPVPNDLDGDGQADIFVFRPSTGGWFIRYSSVGYSAASASDYQWGLPGDVPLAADFDRDGKTELTVFRPSTGEWFVRYSSLGYSVDWQVQWGLPGDVPVAADFDRDGATELNIFRPSSSERFLP
jgi:hypothetical protein